MDNEWKNAKLKLENLFTNDKMHGTIKGQLLKMDMKNWLEYFKGNDEKIKASLNTLLLGKVKTFFFDLYYVLKANHHNNR
jgi:hypothetical protein